MTLCSKVLIYLYYNSFSLSFPSFVFFSFPCFHLYLFPTLIFNVLYYILYFALLLAWIWYSMLSFSFPSFMFFSFLYFHFCLFPTLLFNILYHILHLCTSRMNLLFLTPVLISHHIHMISVVIYFFSNVYCLCNCQFPILLFGISTFSHTFSIVITFFNRIVSVFHISHTVNYNFFYLMHNAVLVSWFPL